MKYPIIKNPTPVGSVLYFRNDKEKFRVEECDGVCNGEKGYTLVCICIQSKKHYKVGEEYSFDDRAFRTYNENDIVILDKGDFEAIHENSFFSEKDQKVFGQSLNTKDDILDFYNKKHSKRVGAIGYINYQNNIYTLDAELLDFSSYACKRANKRISFHNTSKDVELKVFNNLEYMVNSISYFE